MAPLSLSATVVGVVTGLTLAVGVIGTNGQWRSAWEFFFLQVDAL